MIRFPILNMRRSVAIAMLVVQLSALLWGALPQALYALHPAMFAAHCVNKAKPMLHCDGRCQMRKATAALLGARTGHALREEIPARTDLPCATPPESGSATATSVRIDRDRTDVRGTDRREPPEIPPPREA